MEVFTNTVDDVLSLEPEEFDTHWLEIDGIFGGLELQRQIEVWEKVVSKLGPTTLSKGHPYFRLGVLHLLADPNEAGAIDFLQQAYEEDKRFEYQIGKPAHRRAAYRVLALVKGFLLHLGALKKGDWRLDQLNPPHRDVLARVLLTIYDGTIPHVLDMKDFTYQEFFKLIDSEGLRRFAIENYFCAKNLLVLFHLEGQHIDRNRDEYPLSRAIVGLFGGVLEAILAARLPDSKGKTLGRLIEAGHRAGVIRVGTALPAVCSLMLYLRNHIHADRDASLTEFFIDIYVAKGSKVAMDWAISDLLRQGG